MNNEKTANKLDYMKQYSNNIISALLEKGMSRREAIIRFMDYISLSYMKEENNVDLLYFAIAFSIEGLYWHEELDIKVLHDIMHCPLYDEVTEDVCNLPERVTSKYNTSIYLGKQYFSLLYKKGVEDIEAFLTRCLCLKCFPSPEFLRLSEKERRSLCEEEIKWRMFNRFEQMSIEDIMTAYNLQEVIVTEGQIDETGLKQ